MNKSVYLDYAAATPIDRRVQKAMQPYLTEKFFNPSSLYRAAREAKADLELARAKIAHELGAQPTEIIFTSGATESINLALQGVAKSHPKGRILCSAIEHHAVLNTVAALGAWRGGEIVKVKPDGVIDLEALEKAIDDKTVLISIGYVNNELGIVQPMAKIGQLVNQIRNDRAKAGNRLPLLWHTDASAAANYLSLSVERLGVDLLTLSGGKIYGPEDSGVLYVRRGVALEPLMYGGGQEKGKRPGTTSVANAVGSAEALKIAQSDRTKESERLAKLKTELINGLADIKDVSINANPKHTLPNFINCSIAGVSGEDLVLYLDAAGFMVSTGAACTIGQAQPSHVLLAIGLSQEQANSSLRLTLGRQTTSSEIKQFLREFPKVLAKLRRAS